LTISPTKFAIQFNNQNTVFLIVLNVGLAKTLAQVHHGNNFPAKIDDPSMVSERWEPR